MVRGTCFQRPESASTNKTIEKNNMCAETTRQMPGEVFFDNLSEINEGRLLSALDTKLTALVAAVLETGNNGNITLKLTVKRKGGMNQVVIEPKVTASIPEHAISPRIMFADGHGGLHTDDPNQGQLKLDAPVKVNFEVMPQAGVDTPKKVKQA